MQTFDRIPTEEMKAGRRASENIKRCLSRKSIYDVSALMRIAIWGYLPFFMTVTNILGLCGITPDRVSIEMCVDAVNVFIVIACDGVLVAIACASDE